MTKEKSFEETVMERIVIKDVIGGVICGYDSNNNLIYTKNHKGEECWRQYDNDGKRVHFKDYDGCEYIGEYDEKNNLIYCKRQCKDEYWYTTKGHLVHYKHIDGDEHWYGINHNEITKEEYDKLYNK